MKQILSNASDAIVLAARLYRELALSALTLLPTRRDRREDEGLALVSEPAR